MQTSGGPNWPRVQRIEMTGDYPCATLRFIDSEMPLQLEMQTFTPFAPIDARFSSMPLAAFIFRIHNPTQQSHQASLALLAQNPVGYEADGANNSAANPCFGWNFNEPFHYRNATGILMSAKSAPTPTIDQPLAVCIGPELKELKSPPSDLPQGLTVEVFDNNHALQSGGEGASKAVIWMEDAPVGTTADLLRQVAEAVRDGATLLFSGHSMPLLQAYAAWTGGKPVAEAQNRPDIVFEDFERGYENWRVEGEAFGPAPAQGTLPNQQRVSGFQGRGLVNSYFNGDATTGRLISKPFVIERRFIRFLVGGGHFADTQIRLIINGNVQRATSGKDNERLEPAVWEVAEFEGKSAHIEIVDEEKGGWGHINVDQIEFSDVVAPREIMALLEELLPARFSKIIPARNAKDAAEGEVEFENLTLQTDGSQSTAPVAGAEGTRGTVLYSRPVGRGKVVLANGVVLDPASAGISHQRRRALQLVCGLAGARYEAAPGQNSQAPGFGTLALATLGKKATVLPAFDDLEEAWQALVSGSGLSRSTMPKPACRHRLAAPFMAAWRRASMWQPEKPLKSPSSLRGTIPINTTAKRPSAATMRHAGLMLAPS